MTGHVDVDGGRRHGAVLLVIVASGVCGFLAVMVGTGRYGAGVTPDSVTYVWAARGLLSGRGMQLVYGDPYTMWGPLYPWVLATLGLTGLDLWAAGRVLNAVLFAGIVTLPGLWLLRDSRHPVLALFATLMALTSATLVWAATVLSEPLFIVLVLLALWRMRDFVTRSSTRSLVIAALPAGAACLTRYIGVSVVATGGLLLLAAREGSLHKRIRNCILFGGIALLPLGLWLARNRLVTGSLAGTRRPATSPFIENVSRLGGVLAGTLCRQV